MRIMLDTNILISAVIFDSEKLKQVLMYICNNHTLVLSSYIVRELENVIERKFTNKIEVIEEVLNNIPYELEDDVSLDISEENKLKIRDKKDIPILYSAINADVDILITGDKDFENIDINRPKIMKPNEFYEIYLK